MKERPNAIIDKNGRVDDNGYWINKAEREMSETARKIKKRFAIIKEMDQNLWRDFDNTELHLRRLVRFIVNEFAITKQRV